jgi:predicted transcriptional regulator
MKLPKLTRLELQIMEALWTNGASSVRQIQDAFASKRRPAFTTVQTTVYRLERKKALRCSNKIGNANLFEAAISRDATEGRLMDELLDLLQGHGKPVMAHLVKSGNLTLDDVKEAEQELLRLTRKDRSK